MYLDVTHVSLRVSDLRAAERYYCDLFELQVAWRDRDGQSMFASWEDIDASGGTPAVILLWSGKLRLALGHSDGEEVPANRQRLGHVGIQVTEAQLRRIRERVLAAGLEVIASRDDELFDFRDRYGVEWELDTRSYDDPVALGRQIEERRARRAPTES
jgi:catechol 2,3-dioxygenase-like lactoylglutathione lyase family enzyme